MSHELTSLLITQSQEEGSEGREKGDQKQEKKRKNSEVTEERADGWTGS